MSFKIGLSKTISINKKKCKIEHPNLNIYNLSLQKFLLAEPLENSPYSNLLRWAQAFNYYLNGII